MHDQINTKPKGHFPLPFTGHTATNRIQRHTTARYGPSGRPIVAANHHRCHTVVQVSKRHAFDLLGIRGGRFNPNFTAVVAPGEIFQQIKSARQHMVLRQRLQRRNIKRARQLLQFTTCGAGAAKARDIGIASIKQDHATRAQILVEFQIRLDRGLRLRLSDRPI